MWRKQVWYSVCLLWKTCALQCQSSSHVYIPDYKRWSQSITTTNAESCYLGMNADCTLLHWRQKNMKHTSGCYFEKSDWICEGESICVLRLLTYCWHYYVLTRVKRRMCEFVDAHPLTHTHIWGVCKWQCNPQSYHYIIWLIHTGAKITSLPSFSWYA